MKSQTFIYECQVLNNMYMIMEFLKKKNQQSFLYFLLVPSY